MTQAAGSEKTRTQQGLVDAYFDQAAPYWKHIYQHNGVYAAIHQERQAMVLAEVERIGLPADSSVLEIGCGAGHTSVALAERGYAVNAIDSVAAMVLSTREVATAAGVERRVASGVADIHELPFPDAAFRMVLAIGVMPFLHPLSGPVREMARVLAPGGYLIVNTDNRWGFSRILNPQFNPLLAPIKRAAAAVLVSAGIRRPHRTSYLVSQSGFDRALDAGGFEKLRGRTLGFGPFAFFQRELLGSARGLKWHRSLQSMADRGVPVVRDGGAQYLVVARRRG